MGAPKAAALLRPVKFKPTYIANCALWLESSYIAGLTDGAAVATWSDLSGHGNDVTQATGTKQPLYKTNRLNGRATVLFDAVDDILSGATPLSGLGARTVIAVVKAGSTASGSSIVTLGDGGAGAGAVYEVSAEVALRVSSGNRVFNTNTGTAAWRVLAVTTPASDDCTGTAAYLDGSALGVTSSLARAIFTQNTSLSIGASTFENVYAGHEIAAAFVYSRVLSTAELSRLNKKWINPRYGLSAT